MMIKNNKNLMPHNNLIISSHPVRTLDNDDGTVTFILRTHARDGIPLPSYTREELIEKVCDV